MIVHLEAFNLAKSKQSNRICRSGPGHCKATPCLNARRFDNDGDHEGAGFEGFRGSYRSRKLLSNGESFVAGEERLQLLTAVGRRLRGILLIGSSRCCATLLAASAVLKPSVSQPSMVDLCLSCPATQGPRRCVAVSCAREHLSQLRCMIDRVPFRDADLKRHATAAQKLAPPVCLTRCINGGNTRSS